MSAVEGVVFEVSAGEVGYIREMLRQQLLGDEELLRDCIAGREDPEYRLEVSDRLRFLRGLALKVGMTDFPSPSALVLAPGSGLLAACVRGVARLVGDPCPPLRALSKLLP